MRRLPGRAVRPHRGADPRAARRRPLRRHALHDGPARAVVPSRDASARRPLGDRRGPKLRAAGAAEAARPAARAHAALHAPRRVRRAARAACRARHEARRLGARLAVGRVRRREPPRRPRGGRPRSGIAVYGKNTLAITRRHGSWVVLGVLVTDVELEPTSAAPEEPAWDACGSCRACIDACPTGAIIDDGVLDARLLPELPHPVAHGRPAAPGELGDRVYGCDICQDVCPWNTGRRSPRRGARAGRRRRRVPAARRVARGRPGRARPPLPAAVRARSRRPPAGPKRARRAANSATATGLIRRSSCSADRRTWARTASGSITSAWPR